ncbi:TonB-dependent siderophore receptor [Fulvivirga ligni]|uniref:TonB-dependent siderophore receptor n=1 Tax=Fulvivirga ligni TaxID=2904246 RepID=UPI0021076431|nr:TonB-dependent siderophore receptor [Fulvivirga ligni]
MRKKLTALIFFISFLSYSFAQSNKGTVNGKVLTADGQPAAYVNLALDNTGYGTITKETGEFTLKAPAGNYTLIISSVGLQKQEIKITVQAGEAVTLPVITLNESIQQLEDVIVQGQSESYNIEQPSQALRMSTPLLEAPQNIQVISKTAIKDQQIVDMLEGVTRNVSGAQMIEHWGNFARINMRGFRIPAMRNGVNIESSWGPLTEDMSMVDRIEFVKGPAGFMMAAGEPGGFYNVVTKKPVLNQTNEVSLMAGSFSTLRGALDIGGKITKDEKLLYRLNIMGSTKDSHRDYEFNDRFTFAPSLKYSFSDRTSVTAEFTIQDSKMLAAGSAYVFSNEMGNLPRDFTIAEPNIDPTTMKEQTVFVNLHHELNDNWRLTTQLGYLNYEQEGNSFWYANLTEDGFLTRTMSSFDALSIMKSGQVYLNGNVETGAVKHRILAGLDMNTKNYWADWWQGGVLGTDSTFNIYNPTHGVPSSQIPTIDRSEDIRVRAYNGGYPAIIENRIVALYVQDELGFFDNKLRLTLAGRHTSYHGESYGSSTEDSKFTPRVGLSFSIDESTSVYGLFDESFLPQTGNDRLGNAFDPVSAKDVEAGIKKNWLDGRWKSSLTVFQITKDNVLTADPENALFSVQLGQVQSKGIEFDVQGEIVSGLSLILNYANTNVEITEDTNEDNIGARVAGHAKHMTNGWLKYTFQRSVLKGVGISLGYQYQVDRSSWNWGGE